MDRMERRREQNRQAAKRSRERRQKELNFLQESVDELLLQNRKLEAENLQLKAMISELRNIIDKQGVTYSMYRNSQLANNNGGEVGVGVGVAAASGNVEEAGPRVEGPGLGGDPQSNSTMRQVEILGKAP
jgi:hypothetical protein